MLKFFLITLCFVQISEIELYCLGPSALFITQPQDAVVSEGGNASFTCKVRNYDPITDSLTWQVHPPRHDTDVTENYDEASHEFTSFITAYKIGRESHLFKCYYNSVLISSRMGRVIEDPICFTSRVAKTTLRQFPKEDEVSCGPQDPGRLEDGSSLEVYCVVPKCYPPVNMSWKFDGSIESNFETDSYSVDGQKRVLNMEITLHFEMHSKTLTCVVAGNQGEKLECPIGPFNILQHPRLTIDPINVVINATSKATLSCISDSYPLPVKYFWTCLPTYLLQGCNSTSATINVSINPNASINFTQNVTTMCSFLTSGSKWVLSNVSTLVLEPSLYMFEEHGNLSGAFDSLSLRIYNIVKPDNISWDIDLICTIERLYGKEKRPEFHWYLGNERLKYTPRREVINESLQMSVLELKNVSLRDNGKAVSCEVGINETIARVNYTLKLASDLTDFSTDQSSSQILLNTEHTRAMDRNLTFVTHHHNHFHRFTEAEVNASFLQGKTFTEHIIFSQQTHLNEFQSSVTKINYIVAITVAAILGFVVIGFSICFATSMFCTRKKNKEDVKKPSSLSEVRDKNSYNIESYHNNGNFQDIVSDPIYEVPKLTEFQAFSTMQHAYSMAVFHSLASSSSSSWGSINDSRNMELHPQPNLPVKDLSRSEVDESSLESSSSTIYIEPCADDLLNSRRRKNSTFSVLLLNVPPDNVDDDKVSGRQRDSCSSDSVSTMSTHSYPSPLVLREKLPPLPAVSALSQEVPPLQMLDALSSASHFPVNLSVGEICDRAYHHRFKHRTYMPSPHPPAPPLFTYIT